MVQIIQSHLTIIGKELINKFQNHAQNHLLFDFLTKYNHISSNLTRKATNQ